VPGVAEVNDPGAKLFERREACLGSKPTVTLADRSYVENSGFCLRGKESNIVSGTVKVMAVDDSKTMLAMIAAHLKGSNFEVVATALNGQEALAKYEQHKPTLVLLDMVMPEMTGSEILQRLLEADQAVCVVMVSSIGTEETVQDCLKKGAKSFLQKPLLKDTMLTTLNNVCQQAGVGS
jgi:two-component system chemotaxis response regulator CheY